MVLSNALYQEVLYEQIFGEPANSFASADWEREESGYGNQASEIDAELAVHFERGETITKQSSICNMPARCCATLSHAES